MDIRSSIWEKISEDEIKGFLNRLTKESNAWDHLTNSPIVLENAKRSLVNTRFDYFTYNEAIELFGRESESYIKPNGLPYIMDPIRKELNYMKGVINIQLNLYEKFLNGSLSLDVSNLSQYVFYSSIAHILSKFGWEPIHF